MVILTTASNGCYNVAQLKLFLKEVYMLTILRCSFIAIGMLSASVLMASNSLYKQEYVSVASEQPNDQAIQSALKCVLVKISASDSLLQNPIVVAAIAKGQDYVASINYQGNKSQILFSEELIQDLIKKADVSTWGSARPKVLLWAAIEDGPNVRFLNQDLDADLFQEILAQTDKYGLDLMVPLHDLEDSVNVNVQDVWGQFPTSLWNSSKRYEPDAILIVKTQPSTEGWYNEWRLMLAQDMQTVEGESVSSKEFVANAVQAVSAKLIDLYGVESTNKQKTFELSVKGINSSRDFANIQRALNQLDAVKNASIKQIQSEYAVFEVQSQATNKSSLTRHLNLHKNFLELSQNDDGNKLYYQWVP
jgi:hypothetical protein